jgi:muconolactone delta-isomerase
MKELKRDGVLIDFDISDSDDPEWRAFLKMRASDDTELKKQLDRLPLASYFHFDITKIKPVAAL